MNLRPRLLSPLSRRAFLGSSLLAGVATNPWLRQVHAEGRSSSRAVETPFRITPFIQDLPNPHVLQPLSVGVAPYIPGEVEGGIAPEFARLREWEQFPTKYYQLTIRESLHEFIPGVETPVWGYDGVVPGPTIISRTGEPAVVRVTNTLDIETSIHLHGGHSPSHSDGFPSFYVLPRTSRDYFYPNTVPEDDGEPTESEAQSTMWYHDHAMDITGHNVYMGLAGFHLMHDALEDRLVDAHVLPSGPQDVPLAIVDRTFNADGTLYYDFLDHNGQLGDTWIVNGVVQPRMVVERRKYRFRILCGTNARFLNLRLSNGQSFLQIAADSWLLPYAMVRREADIAPGNRIEIVVDFRNAPEELYLENTWEQVDGRRPKGTADQPAPFLKFIVRGEAVPNDATVVENTPLRPHVPILPQEIVTTRRFRLGRNQGAWSINGELYDEHRIDATPRLGTAERWIVENGGGGWWHPFHSHLEGHQVQRINGRVPPPWGRYKRDITNLESGGVIEVFQKFRTFTGPFVWHCHTAEHEDMRMMNNFEVQR